VLTGNYSPYGNAVAGGFVSKNSFATFDAIALVVCAVLVVSGGSRVSARGGLHRFGLSLMQFLIGRSGLLILAAAAMFAALVLANSRAGLIAGISGLVVLFGFAVLLASRRNETRWAMVGGAAALSAMIALFAVSGDTVAARFDQLVETRGGAELRPVMWSAATRSISEHPWLGTGLGTFSDVYPLYADRFVPYVIDRAHSDYLEFALGVGIPAAIVWWSALGLLAAMCTVGAVRRRRRRAYSVAAVGAVAVVAVHSVVDFSLQLPAVSLLFAVVLGAGLAQSLPTPARARGEEDASWTR